MNILLNDYNLSQAEVYHKKNYPNRRMLILSDSVSLGAGQYAIKSTYVSQREEIEKVYNILFKVHTMVLIFKISIYFQ